MNFYLKAISCGTLALYGVVAPLLAESLSLAESPNKEYVISIVPTSDKSAFRLHIMRNGSELAAYTFEGELINAYWSPSGHFVAINNHDGHRGWYLWVIALPSGAVIRRDGNVNNHNYDRYTDSGYQPDLGKLARGDIENLYPGVADDHMRTGYLSVAQGWKTGDQLLMFHEFLYDKLAERGAVIWVQNLYQISNKGIAVKSISVHEVTGDWWRKYPPRIDRTLSLKAGGRE